MTETVDGKVRQIRRIDNTHLRLRNQDSQRVQVDPVSHKKAKGLNFDKTSFQWLAQNYMRIFGLRRWTWGTIITGIRNEHILELKSQSNDVEIDTEGH